MDEVKEAIENVTVIAIDPRASTVHWRIADKTGPVSYTHLYVLVPRGYSQQSLTPGGSLSGMEFTSRYGYVGLAVEQKEFVAEGLNLSLIHILPRW